VWKFAEQSELAAPCWDQTDGCREKTKGGENSTTGEKITSVRGGTSDRGQRAWSMGGWAVRVGVLWEKLEEGSKARSPTPERAAVNTVPLGEGSQSKALYLLHQGLDSLLLSSPCTGLQ